MSADGAWLDEPKQAQAQGNNQKCWIAEIHGGLLSKWQLMARLLVKEEKHITELEKEHRASVGGRYDFQYLEGKSKVHGWHNLAVATPTESVLRKITLDMHRCGRSECLLLERFCRASCGS